MKFAVIVFPGSNCDLDMYWAMKEIMGADCEYVRYDAASLDGFDGVLLPGGFSLMEITYAVVRLLVLPILWTRLFDSLKKENQFLVRVTGSKF